MYNVYTKLNKTYSKFNTHINKGFSTINNTLTHLGSINHKPNYNKITLISKFDILYIRQLYKLVMLLHNPTIKGAYKADNIIYKKYIV